MFRYALIVLAAAIAAGPAHASDIPPLRERPLNLSSHSPEFFRDLLAGRVWVHHRHNTPAAAFFDHDGSYKACWKKSSSSNYSYSHSSMEWKIGSSNSASNLELSWNITTTGPGRNDMIIVYRPATGRFHAEQFSRDKQTWKISRDGWVQDQWPFALLHACPKLVLPTDLAIDEYQDTLDWNDIERNATPIRNHPSSEFGYPGATGLAASKGQPTMRLEQVEQLRQRMHGIIGLHNRGFRLVTVNNPGRREIWMLDPKDDVLDVATVTPVPNRPITVVRWKNFQFERSYRVGYPVAVLPTTRRHPAFQMMIDLAKNGQPVPLADAGNAARDHIFKSDGSVQIAAGTGSWWLSRGQLHVQAAGSTQVYPWRDVVALSGWKEQIPRSAD